MKRFSNTITFQGSELFTLRRLPLPLEDVSTRDRHHLMRQGLAYATTRSLRPTVRGVRVREQLQGRECVRGQVSCPGAGYAPVPHGERLV